MTQTATEKLGLRRGTVLVVLLCGVAFSEDCGGSDGSTPATSSSPLADFKACGGDPGGDWRVESYHTDVAEASRVVSDEFGNEPACDGTVTGVRSQAEGMFTFKPDGTYEYVLGVSSDIDLALTDACFVALAGGADASFDFHLTDVECQALAVSFEKQPTLSGAACGFAAGVCSCSISVAQEPLPGQGSYTVRDSELTLSRDVWNFCTHDEKLELMRSGSDGPELLVLVRR